MVPDYTHRTHYNLVPGYTAGSQEHHYAELVAAHQQAWSGSKEQLYIPEVTAGWDKRPWEGERGLRQQSGWFFPDRTPNAFGQFLQSAIEWLDRRPEQTTKERLVLVYAWNEFGEGGYVPGEGAPRPSVAYERVAYLDAPPTDRRYRVIGYVAQPVGRFRSWGEMLNAIRAAAFLHGGDAVFVDNQKELEGWGFSFNNFGGSGGKWKNVQVRAKVIT